MIEAVAGAVIVVVATTSLLYSIELAERAFDKAGRYSLSSDEREVLRSVGFDKNEAELFWRLNIQSSPRDVKSGE